MSDEELINFKTEISNIKTEYEPLIVVADESDSELARTPQNYVQMLFQGKANINDLEMVESLGYISFRIDFNINGYPESINVPLKPLEYGFNPSNRLYPYGCGYFRLFKTENEANEFLKTL